MSTSTDALISISHIRGKLKRRVFAVLRTFTFGATCDKLEQETGLKHQTLSARVRELWQEGWINRLAETRVTRSGRLAHVYKARKWRKDRSPRERCSRCGQVLVKPKRT